MRHAVAIAGPFAVILVVATTAVAARDRTSVVIAPGPGMTLTATQSQTAHGVGTVGRVATIETTVSLLRVVDTSGSAAGVTLQATAKALGPDPTPLLLAGSGSSRYQETVVLTQGDQTAVDQRATSLSLLGTDGREGAVVTVTAAAAVL